MAINNTVTSGLIKLPTNATGIAPFPTGKKTQSQALAPKNTQGLVPTSIGQSSNFYSNSPKKSLAQPTIQKQTPLVQSPRPSSSTAVQTQTEQQNPLFALPGENAQQYQQRVSKIQGSTPQGGTAQASVPTTNPVIQSQSQFPLYSGIVSALGNNALQPSNTFSQNINASDAARNALMASVPTQSQNVQNAQNDIQNLTNQYANLQGVIGNSPIGLSLQGGAEGLLSRLFAAKLGAAQTALQNALTGNAQTQAAFTGAGNLANTAAGLATGQQQAQQSGLQAAAGFAAPQLAGFNQQAFNPLSGQFGGGNVQDAVNNVAQRVLSGNMTYQDALSSLSGYGQAGQNALLQALGPNFNVAQSNTLASQQGSIGPNYQLANAAISNLENAVRNLNPLQSTNAPGINAISNFISNQTGFGGQATREFTQAVQSARNAYAALLASVKGGTPTDYSGQALAEVPDNPTPNDIAALRHSFEVLGQARKDIFGNPGQAGQSGQYNATGNSLYNF